MLFHVATKKILIEDNINKRFINCCPHFKAQNYIHQNQMLRQEQNF